MPNHSLFSDDSVIEVSKLSKCYEIYAHPRDRLKQLLVPSLYQMAGKIGFGKNKAPTYFREFWALRDISFKIRPGEVVGIIGRNGSGKSTLLQIIAQTLSPTSGEVRVSGRLAALLELGSGFNPEFTGRENIFLNGYILGLKQKEILERYEQIVEFADIGDFINQPVKTYSSGMFVRLAFAVQAHVDASVVIIDEALAVGDVFFRQKCYARLEQLRNSGAAILLVSHSMTDIEQYCERALLLEQGTLSFIGESSEATKRYYLLHQSAITTQFKTTKQVEDRAYPPPKNSLLSSQCPLREAMLDLSAKVQVTKGSARCTGVALFNEKGEPCNYFHQGEKAIFYYEFELNEAIEIPICGIVIQNDRGILVHGKNSCQYEIEIPIVKSAKSKIYCKQEIVLDLGLGDYTFEVGLAALSQNDWENRHQIPFEEASSRYLRLCHVPDVAFFSVGLAQKNGISKLSHHGLANLAGKLQIEVETTVEKDLADMLTE